MAVINQIARETVSFQKNNYFGKSEGWPSRKRSGFIPFSGWTKAGRISYRLRQTLVLDQSLVN